MFEYTSRYYTLETAQYTTIDRSKIAYKRRRFLPQGASMILAAEVTATGDDRLDLIAAQTLGDPEQFWQVCDINNAMNPADLLAEPVQQIQIPIPQI